MWIKSAGEISGSCDQISTSVSTHILCQGDSVALFDASVWGLREDLEDAIIKKANSLDYVFITHAHFDHLGCLPSLKQKYPNLKVVAGSETVKLLSDTKLIEQLFIQNRESAIALDQEFNLSLNVWKESLRIDIVLNEGEEVDLGSGVVVKAIFLPGHTIDSMAYLIKADGVLVSGDGLGAYNGRDFVTPSFSASFSDYLSSLSKLGNQDVQKLSLGHSGVLTGELVPRFLADLANDSKKLANEIKLRFEEGESKEDIALSIADEWESELRLPEGPFREIHKECIQGIVKAVL